MEPDGYVVRDKRRVGPDGAEDASAAVPGELVKAQEELKQAKELSLRMLADFENTKKRLQREKAEDAKFATETVMRELLPILDSLDHALVAVDKQSDPEAITKGVHLIYRQLLGLLEKEGVTRIAAVGERFDPHRHEAVAQVPADEHHADGTVVEEVHVGYSWHGRVIRHAMVKVAQHMQTPVGGSDG